MTSFELALPAILEHEGGPAFTNDPVDPGGATRWGISLRYLRARGDLDRDGHLDGDVDHDGDIDAQDIRLLSKEQAARVYETGFWVPNRLAEVSSQRVATKIFDTAVNLGSAQAWRRAQLAAQSLSIPIADDGKVGPKTLAAVNSLPEGLFMRAYCGAQRAFYESLIRSKPALSKYRRGWTRRAAWPYTLEELKWVLKK